ncbi:helix-turn-helix domain-containing protein [Brevundimonas sp.]
MTALERLGLEVAAYQLLGSRTKAAVLCALIAGGGAAVSFSGIANARCFMGSSEATDPGNVAKTRICLLRESLEDVGHPDLIVTQPGGYALPEPGRQQIIDRLTEVAA